VRARRFLVVQRNAAQVIEFDEYHRTVSAAWRVRWLGAYEGWRHDDLVTEHQAIHDQVMAVNLPAPGRLC
jgi:hypothetical protein